MPMIKIIRIALISMCCALLMMPFQVFAHTHHQESPIPKAKPNVQTGEKNTLQKLIDATEPGGTLLLEGRTYRGTVIISKPITIKGSKDTKIASLDLAITISNTNNVVIEDLMIQAENIAIIGEEVDSLLLKNIQVEQRKAGIQLTNSSGITLENVDITGEEGHFSTKGHAIAIYKSKGVQAANCDIWRVMDGFYLEQVDNITLKNNSIKEGRYAVHLMYSDNVEITTNKLESNMTGLMIMVANNVSIYENQITKNNTLNSLGVYLYDDEDVDFHENVLSENTVAMSIENTRNMEVSNNEFSTNGTAIQAKKSETLQLVDNQFFGNILTMRTDRKGVQLHHNFYDDYAGKDYDGDGIGDTKYIATNSFGQWMVRKPVYQYFIESPSVVILNLMDTEVTDGDTAIQIDESPVVMKKNTSQDISINAWQLGCSLVVLMTILFARRKLR